MTEGPLPSATLDGSDPGACQLAIKPEFDRVVEAALGAGWRKEDVAIAMFQLAFDGMQRVDKDLAARRVVRAPMRSN